jgi:hypothetical protein
MEESSSTELHQPARTFQWTLIYKEMIPHMKFKKNEM